MHKIAANLVTEDDKAANNLFSAKQKRLLVEPLYSSWQPRFDDAPDEKRIFLSDSNVEIFTSVYQPPIVPDVFLSLDVEPNPEWFAKEHRSYFVWEFDKVPEVALEIVRTARAAS